MNDLISREIARHDLHTQLFYRMGRDEMKKRLDNWLDGLSPVRKWIPIDAGILPPLNRDGYSDYVLVSFSNCLGAVAVAQYRTEEDGSGAFYDGDSDETFVSKGIFVSAWQKIEAYREGT